MPIGDVKTTRPTGAITLNKPIKDIAQLIKSTFDEEPDAEKALSLVEHELARLIFQYKTDKKFRQATENDATKIVVDIVRTRLLNYTPSTN